MAGGGALAHLIFIILGFTAADWGPVMVSIFCYFRCIFVQMIRIYLIQIFFNILSIKVGLSFN